MDYLEDDRIIEVRKFESIDKVFDLMSKYRLWDLCKLIDQDYHDYYFEDKIIIVRFSDDESGIDTFEVYSSRFDKTWGIRIDLNYETFTVDGKGEYIMSYETYEPFYL